MKRMFSRPLTIGFFLMIGLIAGACSKDDTSVTKQGGLKAVVHFTQNPSRYMSLYNGLKVILSDNNNNLLATQYVYGTGETVDFGIYEYGDYIVKVQGDVYASSSSGPQVDHSIDQSQNAKIDAPTKTVTFEVK